MPIEYSLYNHPAGLKALDIMVIFTRHAFLFAIGPCATGVST